MSRRRVEAKLPGNMVQMMVMTINGTQYALFGPVVLPPGTPVKDEDIDITEVHFGEILSASAAAELLQGSHIRELGAEMQ